MSYFLDIGVILPCGMILRNGMIQDDLQATQHVLSLQPHGELEHDSLTTDSMTLAYYLTLLQ